MAISVFKRHSLRPIIHLCVMTFAVIREIIYVKYNHSCILIIKNNFKSSQATQHCRRCSVTDDYFSIYGMQWYSYYLLHRFLQISMSNPKLYFEEGRTVPWLNEKEQNVK